jgi:hypothetical protein
MPRDLLIHEARATAARRPSVYLRLWVMASTGPGPRWTGTPPNGHMSRSPLGTTRALEPFVKIARPAQPGVRLVRSSAEAPDEDRRFPGAVMATGFTPSRHQVPKAWIVDRRDPAAMVALAGTGVTRTIDQGLDPLDETRARCQPALSPPGGDTPARVRGIRCPGRQGGRGLSHPQDGPLTLTGAAELQPGPGPCGQLGSRTANRMAGHRALPLGSVRDLHGLAPAR